jgi:hypothetical protein
MARAMHIWFAVDIAAATIVWWIGRRCRSTWSTVHSRQFWMVCLIVGGPYWSLRFTYGDASLLAGGASHLWMTAVMCLIASSAGMRLWKWMVATSLVAWALYAGAIGWLGWMVSQGSYL